MQTKTKIIVYSSALLATVFFALFGVYYNLHINLGIVFFSTGLLLTLTSIVAYCFDSQSGKIVTQTENCFEDFKVILDKGKSIVIEVWYFYDGALGDNVGIRIDPMGEDKKRLPGGATMSGTDINIVRHRALAHINYTYQPMRDSQTPDKSKYIQLCMTSSKGTFHCQTFKYVKEWKD